MRCIKISLWISTDDSREKSFSLRQASLRYFTSERKECTEKRIFASWQTLLRTRARIHMTDTIQVHNTHTQTHSKSNRSEQQTPIAYFALIFFSTISCFVYVHILKYISRIDPWIISSKTSIEFTSSNHMFELLSLIIVKLERKIVCQKGAHRKERYKHNRPRW